MSYPSFPYHKQLGFLSVQRSFLYRYTKFLSEAKILYAQEYNCYQVWGEVVEIIEGIYIEARDSFAALDITADNPEVSQKLLQDAESYRQYLDDMQAEVVDKAKSLKRVMAMSNNHDALLVAQLFFNQELDKLSELIKWQAKVIMAEKNEQLRLEFETGD